jgi:hypothetical protein
MIESFAQEKNMKFIKTIFISIAITNLAGCMSTDNSLSSNYNPACSPNNNDITNMISNDEDRAIIQHSATLLAFLETSREVMKEKFSKTRPKVFYDKVKGIDSVVNNMRLFKMTYFRSAYNVDNYCGQQRYTEHDYHITTQYLEFAEHVKFISKVHVKHGNIAVLETVTKRRSAMQRSDQPFSHALGED